MVVGSRRAVEDTRDGKKGGMRECCSICTHTQIRTDVSESLFGRGGQAVDGGEGVEASALVCEYVVWR